MRPLAFLVEKNVPEVGSKSARRGNSPCATPPSRPRMALRLLPSHTWGTGGIAACVLGATQTAGYCTSAPPAPRLSGFFSVGESYAAVVPAAPRWYAPSAPSGTALSASWYPPPDVPSRHPCCPATLQWEGAKANSSARHQSGNTPKGKQISSPDIRNQPTPGRPQSPVKATPARPEEALEGAAPSRSLEWRQRGSAGALGDPQHHAPPGTLRPPARLDLPPAPAGAPNLRPAAPPERRRAGCCNAFLKPQLHIVITYLIAAH